MDRCFVCRFISARIGIRQKARTLLAPRRFPCDQPWQGADAAYSIPLPDGRDVWIFGDTLYGDKRLVIGEEPRMVHNTVGMSTCENGKWKIDYTFHHDANGKLGSIFKPQQNNGTCYWALDGVEYNNELWITLLCVRNAPMRRPPLLPWASRSAEPISPT